MVKGVRARLDLAGFRHVEIMVGGDITVDDIRRFVESEAPVNTFGVGQPIACAAPIPYSFDIKEIDGRPVARRGRSPGITTSPRLARIV